MKTCCCQSKKFIREKDFAVCTNLRCENYMHPTNLQSSQYWNNIFFVFFFIFFFVLSFDDYSSDVSAENQDYRNIKKLEMDFPTPLTVENVREELDVCQIICPEQVYAQIMIESAHLTSYLAKRTNNLLGMRYPFRRSTTASGIFLPSSNLIIKGTQEELKKYRNQNHYAVYDSWQDCIRDYKYWQEQSFKLTEIYLKFLGKYYAEDTLYVKKIRQMVR